MFKWRTKWKHFKYDMKWTILICVSRKNTFIIEKYFLSFCASVKKFFFAKCSNAQNKLLLQRYFSENCLALQNETKNHLNFEPSNYGKLQSHPKVWEGIDRQGSSVVEKKKSSFLRQKKIAESLIFLTVPFRIAFP